MFNKYADFYDLFNRDKPYKKEIEFVYKWSEKPKSVFDIGAGTGSYWKYYPAKTHIFGIDKSRHMAHQSKNIACADITKYRHTGERFDCATALFDVLNYISKHEWWKNLPIKKGGYFIFDIWDKKKVTRDGFRETKRSVSGITRWITPSNYTGRSVDLKIMAADDFGTHFTEIHKMYLHSHADIKRFCGKEFEVVDVNPTKRWQTWWKLRRL